MSFRVRQVCQVGVLEKVNRTQLAVAEGIGARRARQSVLEKLIDSQNRRDFLIHQYQERPTR